DGDGATSTDAGTAFEVISVLLGRGDDHLEISGTALPAGDPSSGVPATHGGLTVVHGGGGDDTVVVSGGGGPDSPLVVYGDTSQDGVWYAGDSTAVTLADLGPKPFPDVLGSASRFRVAVAVAYDAAGDDLIDASALFAGGDLPS